MKIIWALYDDGNCSYKKAIEQNFNGQYEVHCVGINEPPFEDSEFYKYHKIDLSIFNEKLIEQLSELPKPDIILASPPCESWSNADTIKNYKPDSITLNNRAYFLEQNEKFYQGQRKSMFRNFYKKQRTRIFGEATIMATIWIIEEFKPKVWVIENPMTSRSWRYQNEFLNFYGFENKAYYNCYNDYPVKKPTIFKSNIEMELRTQNIKAQIEWSQYTGYDMRSIIPTDLIKDIITQIEHPRLQQMVLIKGVGNEDENS